MSAPTPIDPELLRSRLTQAVEPVQPSPDALREIRTGIRRRKLRISLGTGAGALLITGGAVAAVIAIGGVGTPQATVTLEPGQITTDAAPATTASRPTPTTAVAVPSSVRSVDVGPAGGSPAATGLPGTGAAVEVTSVSAVTTSASVVTSSPVTVAVTSKPPAHPAAVPHDVDGDGLADTVTVHYATADSAQLVLHRSSGKVVTTAAFRLIAGLGVGDLTFVDIDGDGRAEVIVRAGGASAESHELFQYVGGQLVHVAAAGGWSDPFLVSGGGGGGAGLSFGCTGGSLVLSHYTPTDPLHFTAGPQQTFTFRTTRFSVTGGVAHVLSSRTETLLSLAEARSVFAAESDNRCGAPI